MAFTMIRCSARRWRATAHQARSVPASTAVPTAAAKQHNENNNDEKRGDIHLRIPPKCCTLRSLDFLAF
jgi:hypothetical protein